MSNTAHPCYNVDIKRGKVQWMLGRASRACPTVDITRNIVENNNGKRKDLWKKLRDM